MKSKLENNIIIETTEIGKIKNQRIFYINISNISSQELIPNIISKLKQKIKNGEFDNKLNYTKPFIDDNFDSYYIPILSNKKAYEIIENEIHINNIEKVLQILDNENK